MYPRFNNDDDDNDGDDNKQTRSLLQSHLHSHIK